MSASDIVIATLFYQFSLYVCIRLARRGFTLGELGVVCNAATALFMETVNMTRMKVGVFIQYLTDKSDSNLADSVHQDVPAPDTACSLSTRSDTRIIARRLDPLSAALSLQAPRANTSSSTTIPSREDGTSPTARSRFLCRCGVSLRRYSRYLDALVPRLAGPMALGRLVDARRPTTLDSASLARLLGRTRRH